MMNLMFQKLHGNGNDFIFIEKGFLTSFSSLSDLRYFAIKICKRGAGVGADGVIFCDDAQNQLLILNSNGSFAATCGNALRCYGLKLLQEKQWDGQCPMDVKRLTPRFLQQLVFDAGETFVMNEHEVFATLVHGDLSSKNICVAMGRELQTSVVTIPESLGQTSHLSAVFVMLANPHFVFISPDFAFFTEEQFKQFGKWAQTDLLNTLSVEIPVSNISMVCAEPLAENKQLSWNLVVYERGAGLTLCCGSGAVASRVALETLGLVKVGQDKVSFSLPGGPVEISSWDKLTSPQRTLTGGAELVYRGVMEWI